MERKWFQRDTVLVAQELIGCYLQRHSKDGSMTVRITETEAYRGQDDPASHAYKGETPRNSLMFGEVGKLYVYFIYGMHYCMNVVAHEEGQPGAVLIRAADMIDGAELLRKNRPDVKDKLLLNGPAKLTKALDVDLSLNGIGLLDRNQDSLVLLEKDESLKVICSTRIGISKGTDLMWGFESQK